MDPMAEPTACDPERPPPAASAAAARADRLGALVGRQVVLDVKSPLVYLGRLVEVGPDFVVLEDADVHDVGSGGTTKERYVLEARRHGVRKNRDEVFVRRDEVVSLSLLERVTVY